MNYFYSEKLEPLFLKKQTMSKPSKRYSFPSDVQALSLTS